MKTDQCNFCGRSFRSRRGKLYCSDQCRWRGWAKSVKNLEDSEKIILCIYCGMPADSIDHIPPKCIRPFILEDEYMKKRHPFIEVDACRECNSALGAKLPWDISGRKLKIKEYLKKKYRHFLKIADWSEEELKDMDRILKDEIRIGLFIKKITKKRLQW